MTDGWVNRFVRIVPFWLVVAVFGAFPIAANAQLLAVPSLPDAPYQYQKKLPEHLQKLKPLAISNKVAALGRVLFYDLKLSKNGLVSCASCHSQSLGFDDPTRFSIGFEGKITRRHAMGLANGLFNRTGRFFWDERASTLEEQVLMPFFDLVEMGLDEAELLQKISQAGYYSPLFDDAFGDDNVNLKRVAQSLAEFVLAMVSDQSAYDLERQKVGIAAVDFAGFTNAENRGKFLFFTPVLQGGAGCSGCHQSDAFVMSGPRNNGLDVVSTKDRGWAEVSGKPLDDGKFRAASLKNIALRAPYMHDARFETLGDVVEHYNSGVKPHANLDSLLKNSTGTPLKLNLDVKDKEALVAFLGTLSDPVFLNDPKFSNPFRNSNAFSQVFAGVDIVIENAIIRPTFPKAGVAGGYLTIRNIGNATDRLISATASFTGEIEILTGETEIFAGQEIILKPGDNHLILKQLRQPLNRGEKRKMKLRFEKAGEIEIVFSVEQAN